jgi:hypothetical protein
MASNHEGDPSGLLAALRHPLQVRGSLQRFYVIDPTVDRTPWVRESLGLTP